MIPEELKVRPALDGPDRCEERGPLGQCPHKKVPGTNFCFNHKKNLIERGKELAEVRNYRLLKFQRRVNEFADNSKIKSIREEIGILRMCLEETINKCNDTTELILYSGKICDIIMKIEKLVVSCHRLEFATGTLLDKSTIINIANVMIDTVCKYVNDPDDLEKINNKIMDTILTTKIEMQEIPQSRVIPHGA